MKTIIRQYRPADLPAMREIWNAVVNAGNAFPQSSPLSQADAGAFFSGQSFSAVAECDGEIAGLYILHPNNIGRCGHLANASYAVKETARGRRLGEALVRHSMETARELGFRVLQFNAVVSSNTPAIQLYRKLGFVELGTIPGGFRLDNGNWADITLFYHLLPEQQAQ